MCEVFFWLWCETYDRPWWQSAAYCWGTILLLTWNSERRIIIDSYVDCCTRVRYECVSVISRCVMCVCVNNDIICLVISCLWISSLLGSNNDLKYNNAGIVVSFLDRVSAQPPCRYGWFIYFWRFTTLPQQSGNLSQPKKNSLTQWIPKIVRGLTVAI